MKILILSPHRDDAAFSLTLAIQNWLTAGHTVTIINVFTRSLYAPYSDADFVHENDRLSYVSAMRLREDELWIQRMTHDLPRAQKSRLQMVDLNLKDAPIRLRIPLEALSDTPVNLEDPSIEKIRKSLTRATEAGAMQALVVPLALGNHVDHLTVREAAQPSTTTIPTAFYEDLPYAATHPTATGALDALSTSNTPFDQPLSPILYRTESAIDFKRHLALGYASQIDEAAADTIANFAARYDTAERLWANHQWLSALAT